jgi:hypothetical protein
MVERDSRVSHLSIHIQPIFRELALPDFAEILNIATQSSPRGYTSPLFAEVPADQKTKQ